MAILGAGFILACKENFWRALPIVKQGQKSVPDFTADSTLCNGRSYRLVEEVGRKDSATIVGRSWGLRRAN